MEKILKKPLVKFFIYAIGILVVYIGLGNLLPLVALQFDVPIRRLLINPILDLTTIFALYFSYKFLWSKLEDKPFSEFENKNMPKTIGSSVLVVFIFAAIIFGILYLNGNLTISQGDGFIVVLDLLFFSLATAFAEEILFRGILFRITEEKFGSIISMLFSAFLFGIAHLFNENATILSAISIGLEAGLALSALYMLTRNLWACIIAHATWNFLESNIGVAVSGTPSTKSFFKSTLSGDTLLTGGDFGVEFSIITVLLGIGIGLYLLYIAYKKNMIRPPFWKNKDENLAA